MSLALASPKRRPGSEIPPTFGETWAQLSFTNPFSKEPRRALGGAIHTLEDSPSQFQLSARKVIADTKNFCTSNSDFKKIHQDILWRWDTISLLLARLY